MQTGIHLGKNNGFREADQNPYFSPICPITNFTLMNISKTQNAKTESPVLTNKRTAGTTSATKIYS